MEMPVECVTPGAGHYFFGYYDKCPWDRAGGRLLALRGQFMDRNPGPEDRLQIGMVNLESCNRFEVLAETSAWCWQQGCMLQWLPSGEILYNTRLDNRFVAVVLDPDSGKSRVLPRAVYAVDVAGTTAACVNFSRLHDNRPGYGYAGVADPWRDESAPHDDGIYIMNLATGENELKISLAEIVASLTDGRGGHGAHWFNHLQFTPGGERFVFLHRWMEPGLGRLTRMFTASRDGSEVFLLADDGMVSHFDWRDDEHLLAWAHQSGRGDRYFLFRDRGCEVQAVGEGVLTEDGHCSYSPDREWILSDTYPDPASGIRTLFLFHPRSGRRIDVGRFYGPKPRDTSYRCDLHPRWSRCGRRVCIDSIHEGDRKMYVLDVSAIVEGQTARI